jgi:rod shape-determining protein MreC
MFKRPQYIALGLVALLTLILLNLPTHTASQLKLAVGSLFLPLFGLSKTAQQVRTQATTTLVPRSTLLAENEQLRRTNQELQLRAMQGDIALRENDQLRQLVGWQRQTQWGLKLASVIARDPANWWRIIQLDVGTRDGVRIDMPVLTGAGLVGRVSAVTLTTSQVALIGSPECKVGALVTASGDTGVITTGASSVDRTLVNLSYLSNNTNIKPGQKVFTWGEGRVFPKGIFIGQVADDPHQVVDGYSEATVKLAVDTGQLEEVWVLLK